MTVAELKRRLVPGTKLTLVRSLMGPTAKLRTVVKVGSKDIIMHSHEKNQNSYLGIPKAADLVETENGFQILEDGVIAVEYIWGHATMHE